MDLDLKQHLFEQLAWHWNAQLRPRLDGLTDEEYFWEPVAGCWSVRAVDGRWRPDRGIEPDPPPPTTIGWRLCHIGEVLGARASFHFGDGSWHRDRVTWPGSAADALRFVDEAWDAWAKGIDGIAPEALDQASEGPPGTLDGRFPLAGVIQHVNREVIHHGAEVALLRDLWRAGRPQDPFIGAALAADRSAIERLMHDDPDIVTRARAAHPALLVRAAEARAPAAVALLLELGFDVDAMTTRSALHVAAGNGDTETLAILLEAGADPTGIDPGWGANALGWAEYFEQADTARMLRSWPSNG